LPESFPLERAAQAMPEVMPPSPGSEPAAITSPGALVNGAAQVPLDRVLDSIAAFYQSEELARQATEALMNTGHGLSSNQVKLLGPGSARSMRLKLLIPRWRGRRKDADSRGIGALGIVAALCALLVSLVAMFWLATEAGSSSTGETMSPLLVLLVVLSLALIATLVLMLGRRPTLPGRFERTVQRQLAAGSWAVVVRGANWKHQAGVLLALRSGSHAWCATWSAKRRL
jgi:hypothetical protein